jgi:hypothetical protein
MYKRINVFILESFILILMLQTFIQEVLGWNLRQVSEILSP